MINKIKLKINMKGRGSVNKDDSIEYGKNPMEELAENQQEETPIDPDMAVPSDDMKDVPVDPAPAVAAIDEAKIRTDPTPAPSNKTPFNDQERSNALDDREDEGGVAPYRSTGRVASGQTTTLEEESEIIKPKSDMEIPAEPDKYEVTGFTAQFKYSMGKIGEVEIRDYFNDLESAFLSINRGKYLMPVRSGFRVASIIKGSPTICFNNRLIYEYVEDHWKRV